MHGEIPWDWSPNLNPEFAYVSYTYPTWSPKMILYSTVTCLCFYWDLSHDIRCRTSHLGHHAAAHKVWSTLGSAVEIGLGP